MPVLGLGTWKMGEDPRRRRDEVAALRLGLDLGMTLIDTAELYSKGESEKVVAEAMVGRRDEVFLVTKVMPENASFEGTLRACDRSLARLKTDRIDLYLLHWKGRHPIEETLRAFGSLRESGKIRHFGVSNFDVADMTALERVPGGRDVASNQVLYHVDSRGIERRLVPWCRSRGVVVMAYSPLAEGKLRPSAALKKVAVRHDVSPYAVAIAWTIREDGIVTIPKAGSVEHVRDNAAAATLRLTPTDVAELDAAHPTPDQDVPLDTA
ncbi:MAG: aldo/keto reductase [Planctomycetes bacterium]|nr:aldo/keto reductase [Planctomycetota bacterium]